MHPNLIASVQFSWEASSVVMDAARTGGPNSPMARRMRRLREAMGYNVAAEFAANIGMSPTRWNNFERGRQPVSKGAVELLVKKTPGLTSDWLLYGNPDGLSVQLYRQLDGDLPPTGKASTRS